MGSRVVAVETQAEAGRARDPHSGSAGLEPTRGFERAVYAALVLAGRAVSNRELRS